MTAAASDWPAGVRFDADGVRLGWLPTAGTRIQLDDGFVRQAPTGHATRIVELDVVVEGDSGRRSFDAWVAELEPSGEFRGRLPPDAIARTYTLVGGRGGVSWIGLVTAEGRRWWRGRVVCRIVERFAAPPQPFDLGVAPGFRAFGPDSPGGPKLISGTV